MTMMMTMIMIMMTKTSCNSNALAFKEEFTLMLFYVDRYTAVDQRGQLYYQAHTSLGSQAMCVRSSPTTTRERRFVDKHTYTNTNAKYVLGQVDILKQHLGRGKNFCSPSQV